MDRKTILAFALSGLVLLGYTFFVNKYYPPVPPKPAQQVEPQKPAAEIEAPPPIAQAPPIEALPQQPETTIKVNARLFRAMLSNRGAVATGWTLNRLPDGKEIKNASGDRLDLFPEKSRSFHNSFRLEVVNQPEVTTLLDRATWRYEGPAEVSVTDGAKQSLVFSFVEPSRGLTATKTFTFGQDLYQLELKVDVAQNGQALPLELVVGPGYGDQSANGKAGYGNSPPQGVIDLDGKIKRVSAGDLQEAPTTYHSPSTGVRWVALTDHYFAIAVRPQSPTPYARFANIKRKEKDEKTGKELDKNFLSAIVPITSGVSNQVFVGPKDRSVLDKVSAEWGTGVDLEDLIDYGMLSFMVKPLIPVIAWGLGALNALFGNYGWSIIVFTIIINIFLFPLRWKSSVAMKKAQKMQPQMKALQEKMKKVKKDDPEYQKLQAEQVQLMKEGNPLGGCLPMLLQMPIFWAIFVMLTISLDVRHAYWFGWIRDLSAADPLHILPIIMCITMVAQSALTPTPTDPQQKMQKAMMTWVMPIALTAFFFWSAPSGLVLYWMFSNVVGVGQQFLINKMA